MSFLSNQTLPISIKPKIKVGGKIYYYRKRTMSEPEKEELVEEEKKKNRQVVVKLYQKKLGSGILEFTTFAIYSTK